MGLYIFMKQLKRMGVVLDRYAVRVDTPLGMKFKKIFDDMGDAISL